MPERVPQAVYAATCVGGVKKHLLLEKATPFLAWSARFFSSA
jgi:hypothetical protein